MPQGPCDLSREPVFTVPRLSDRGNDPSIRQMSGRLARQLGCETGPDEARQMMGSKMLFDCCKVVKNGRILLVLCSERDSLSRFFLPLLDDLCLTRNLDGAPIIVEAHPPTEPLLVKRPQRRLESVIVGRSQNLAGKGAPGN